MKDAFFEGKDFNGEFKALIPRYYPKQYQKYIAEETRLLKQKLKGANRVLEAGIGIGRLIPELAPIVKELIGIDHSELMLKKANEAAIGFKHVNIFNGDLERLGKIFKADFFDYSICVWNTLGNVKDEAQVLGEMAKVTAKSIFITVYLKGTLAKRKNWYETLEIPLEKIDEKNEIFYSKSGLRSKSYSLKDIQIIAKKAGLQIRDSRVLAGVMLWVELSK